MLKKNDQKNEYCFPNYETEQIKEAFDIFDINRNGYIGVDELKEIFTIINEEVSEEELNEMIGLADKEGDGQVNWLNFYEFINGNGISEDIKKMKRIDDEEEIEYEDDYKKNNKKFKLIGENNLDSQKNSNLNESINDSNMNSNNNSNVGSSFSKKKNVDSFKKNKVSHFKYKDDNSFNESNNKSNYSESENNKSNSNDNNSNENNDNLFDEVDDEEKKKDDEKTDNFIAEMLKKKKKNNLENKINIIDGDIFEKRKPKQVMLKQVSLKKTYSLEPKSEKDDKKDNNLQMNIIKNKIFFTGESNLLEKENSIQKKDKEEEKKSKRRRKKSKRRK